MARGPRRKTSSASVSAANNTSDAHDRSSPSPQTAINQIDARPHLEGNGSAKRSTALSALAQTAIPVWARTVVMISLIFGGCCSNVFALEAIVKVEPASGNLITFAQFLLVAFEGLIYHFDSKSPTYLKPNQIPIHRWLVQIALFFSVSVLNNYAFGYNISVPVHIILRSGGSMATMVIGWIWGKRYSRVQVFSVLILTVGIVISALGDSKGMDHTEKSMSRFLQGLSILFIAQVLSAFMGLYIEATYALYGNNYREGLFYTHALALPLFLFFARDIRTQYTRLLVSPPLPSTSPFLPDFLKPLTEKLPRQLVFLVLNSLTQYVCIRGVNILGSISSALTVTIVLNIRKLVSLLLSMWLFGHRLNRDVMIGAAVVFGGGFLYGVESQRQGKMRKMKAAQAKKSL